MAKTLEDDTQLLGRGSESIEGLGRNTRRPTGMLKPINDIACIVLILMRGFGRGDTANLQLLCGLGDSL